jgi:hypothetical protein
MVDVSGIFSCALYMSYLRLDNRELAARNYDAMVMTASGQLKYGSGARLPAQPPQPQSLQPQFHPYRAQPMALSPRIQLQRGPAPPPAPPPVLSIRGIKKLMENIGYPDITDSSKGGIAIWANNTLKSRGYKFLHRVEIIDESVPSMYPIKHFSNVYIWVKVNLTDTMINNVNQMSTDIFYDRGKGLLIVRSASLDTAVAQAALVGLYSKGKVSYYDIMNKAMLERYYCSIKKPKVRKVIYTVLNNLSKR